LRREEHYQLGRGGCDRVPGGSPPG
jgi:hypothetical protein